MSSSQTVISGVPQGSVLGPLLFLILIGDIDEDVASSFISSFADDTRVGNGVASLADMTRLQNDLVSVYMWAKRNNMELNDDKFEHLRYLPTKTASPPCDTPYLSSTNSSIEQKPKLRDLGVTMSQDGTFTEYILEKATAMKSTMGWILRTFRTRDALPMLTLWKSLVLSTHDYCSQLWNPIRVGDIQSLESVQQSFTRQISSTRDLSYWERLSSLGLYSLQRRRERYIAIYVWKILEGLVPNLSDYDSAIHIRNNDADRLGRRCRVPPIARSAPTYIRNIRESSFSVAGPKIFNCLPIYIRDTRSSECNVTQFKAKLDQFLKTVPDEPLIPGYMPYRRCDSNSLIDWLKQPHLHRTLGGSILIQQSSGGRRDSGGRPP